MSDKQARFHLTIELAPARPLLIHPHSLDKYKSSLFFYFHPSSQSDPNTQYMASPLSTTTATLLIFLLFIILMVSLSPVTAEEPKKPDLKAILEKLKGAGEKKDPKH